MIMRVENPNDPHGSKQRLAEKLLKLLNRKLDSNPIIELALTHVTDDGLQFTFTFKKPLSGADQASLSHAWTVLSVAADPVTARSSLNQLNNARTQYQASMGATLEQLEKTVDRQLGGGKTL